MSNIYCVQDRTGTAAQLTLDTHAPMLVAINDTGIYSGRRWDGAPVSFDFTVGQVLDPTDFGITTMKPDGSAGIVMQSGWPRTGMIEWLTGSNQGLNSTVIGMTPANAYTTVAYFEQYNNSRGNIFPASPVEPIQQAIVQATDYLDQRYRFKGIKLLQFISDFLGDPMIAFIDPWLMPFGFMSGGPNIQWNPLWTPSTTQQRTQWPRQGVVDDSGDTLYGVPRLIQDACCELALRAVNGTILQPDYDPTLVGQGGGIASSISQEVGPIKVTRSFDTKLGLSFFPDFPHVRRMLTQGGVLVAGGGRSIIR